MIRKWEDLPKFMQCEEVREYYDILRRKLISLYLKRIFDMLLAAILLVVLEVPMAAIAVIIKLDSKGPVFYWQERITAYGRKLTLSKALDQFEQKNVSEELAAIAVMRMSIMYANSAERFMTIWAAMNICVMGVC